MSLMDKKHARRAKQRRRLKPVPQDLMSFAGRVITHARRWTLHISRNTMDQAVAFAKTYKRFAYG